MTRVCLLTGARTVRALVSESDTDLRHSLVVTSASMSNMAKSSLRQGSHGMKLPMCHMVMHNHMPRDDDKQDVERTMPMSRVVLTRVNTCKGLARVRWCAP